MQAVAAPPPPTHTPTHPHTPIHPPTRQSTHPPTHPPTSWKRVRSSSPGFTPSNCCAAAAPAAAGAPPMRMPAGVRRSCLSSVARLASAAAARAAVHERRPATRCTGSGTNGRAPSVCGRALTPAVAARSARICVPPDGRSRQEGRVAGTRHRPTAALAVAGPRQRQRGRCRRLGHSRASERHTRTFLRPLLKHSALLGGRRSAPYVAQTAR